MTAEKKFFLKIIMIERNSKRLTCKNYILEAMKYPQFEGNK